MKIGGFVKQSLIDYPGKIASIIFTMGCNFRCGYCHNPQLVLPGLFHSNQLIKEEEIFRYLEERKSWLEGGVVTGGEPTIHQNLPDFLKQIKEIGYKVKLDTNGSNPEMIKLLLANKLVDYIAMDIKTVLISEKYLKIIGLPNKGSIVESIISSILIIKNASIDYEFRTTSIPGLHTQQTLEEISGYFTDGDSYIVNEFREGDTVSSSCLYE